MTDFRVVKDSDLDFFLQLMDLMDWGMTVMDYKKILKFSSEGSFIVSKNGEDLGLVTTVNYGDTAWIGNLVILPKNRGQGIGTKLMKHAMDYLASTGTKSIKLDGVPLAIPLYHRLGFKYEYWSLRFIGVARKNTETNCSVMRKEDLRQVAELDLSVFKLPRRNLIEYFYGLYPELCFTAWDDSDLVGYIIAKPGKCQIKLGPWIAKQGYSLEAEQLLYSVMNKRVGENLWVGVPQANRTCIRILEKNEFTRLPSSLRMCQGDCGVIEEVESIYGIGGPDKG
jgi:predicted GNAT family acetyltransferase